MNADKRVTDVQKVRRYLKEIPDHYAEASHYLIPGSAPIDPTSTRGNTIFRMPISAEIFDLLNPRDKDLDDVMLSRKYPGFANAERADFNINNGQRRTGVLPTLGMWVSLAYTELEDLGADVRECCPARAHTVAGECDWLGEHASAILDLHPDFLRDIEKLWEELRRACRIRREYVPTCPVCATATRRWRIEAVYGSEDDLAPAWWRCTGCPKTWVHDAEVSRLASTQPKMTLRQMADWWNVPIGTLRRWKTEGRFDTDQRGYAEVDHVKRAAAKVGRIFAVPA